MYKTAKCDIEFIFKKDDIPVSFLLVASTGSGFEDAMLDEFKRMLAPGWTAEAIKHTPSRFTPKQETE